MADKIDMNNNNYFMSDAMTNKAILIESPGKLKIIDRLISEPKADEVLVRVKYASLCGSDVKLFNGTYTASHKYPIVIGHEWVGTVVKSGPESSKKFSIGDIVTGDCSAYCNSCMYCRKDNRNHCISVEKKGITQDGCCAQYIIVNPQHLYLCNKLPDIKALALVEPLAVSVEAVLNHISKRELGKITNALIIGAGGIGALALFMLLDEGVSEITVADVTPNKLAIVDSFGFANVKTVLADLADPEAKTPSGYDLILEAAGSRAALQNAVNWANPCGKIICVGHQKMVEFDFSVVMKKSLTLISSIGSTGGFERAIEITEKYYTYIEKLVTRTLTLDEVKKFFSTELGSNDDVKVVIDLS